MRRMVLALLAAVTVAGCGGGNVGYVPAAYGVPGRCYYVNDPAEALALHAAGLCPPSWVPTPMPLWWHARYAAFYDSGAYYNRYVPVAQRTVYVQHVTVFEKQNSSAIQRDLSNGSWKTSSGSSVSGSQVAGDVKSGNASFGGGGTRSQGFANSGVRSSVSGGGSGSSGGGYSAPRPASGGGGGFSSGGGRSGGGGFSGGGARGR